jgi:hypothetical protein
MTRQLHTRAIAIVLATIMTLAVMPTLAAATPAPATPSAQLTLPANWVATYRTDASVSAWSVTTDGSNVAWVEQSKADASYRISRFDGVGKTVKSWTLDNSDYWVGQLSMSGNRIAFTQNQRVRMLDTATGAFTDVTDGEVSSVEPAIAGGKIVYTRGDSYPWRQIYVHDIAGGTDTMLAAIEGDLSMPAVYGDRVVFVGYVPAFQPSAVKPTGPGILPPFAPGYSVGCVPLSGGTAYPLGYASNEWIAFPAIWGSRAYWIEGPEAAPDPGPVMRAPFTGQTYDFVGSSLAALSLTPSPSTFLKVRTSTIAWMSGNWVWSDSVGGATRVPTKPKVGPQSVEPKAEVPDGQLNWRDTATGEQHVFMTNASYDSFDLGPGLLAWSYYPDASTNSDRNVVIAQFVQPPPPAPALYLGDPNVAWKVRRNRFFEVYGILSPAHATGSRWVQLSFERWVGKRYRYQQTSTATSYSTGSPSQHYGLRLKLKRTGRWRVRAFHPADADGPDMWSGYHSFLVK